MTHNKKINNKIPIMGTASLQILTFRQVSIKRRDLTGQVVSDLFSPAILLSLTKNNQRIRLKIKIKRTSDGNMDFENSRSFFAWAVINLSHDLLNSVFLSAVSES